MRRKVILRVSGFRILSLNKVTCKVNKRLRNLSFLIFFSLKEKWRRKKEYPAISPSPNAVLT